MTSEEIARVCHEANRAYSLSLGDTSHKPWDETPEEIKASAVNGVEEIRRGNAPFPEASHENWMRFKKENGWTYGPVKDLEKKTHPSLIPFDELPLEEQMKDHLFFNIVATFFNY